MLCVNLQSHGKTQDGIAKKTAPGGKEKCEGWSLSAHFSCYKPFREYNRRDAAKQTFQELAMQIQTAWGFVLVKMPSTEWNKIVVYFYGWKFRELWGIGRKIFWERVNHLSETSEGERKRKFSGILMSTRNCLQDIILPWLEWQASDFCFTIC